MKNKKTLNHELDYNMTTIHNKGVVMKTILIGLAGFLFFPAFAQAGFKIEAEPPLKVGECRWDGGDTYFGPAFLKTKSCGGFCMGKVTCKFRGGIMDTGIVIEETEVFCRSVGDDCPSARECRDEKKPHNVFFMGSLGDYQFQQAEENKGPGGLEPVTKDSRSAGATR